MNYANVWGFDPLNIWWENTNGYLILGLFIYLFIEKSLGYCGFGLTVNQNPFHLDSD
jgi:hypothetical protein